MKRKLFTLFISLGIALALTFVISVADFYNQSRRIRRDVFRMHIVANSDTEVDQSLKLKVRDRILEYGKETFSNAVNSEQAESIINDNKNEIIKIARDEILKNGFDYDVNVYVGKCVFPTRTYQNSVTLPAGEYEAINVIIGEGRGHNWWCVMFPPMCLPAAENGEELEKYLDDSELKLVKSNPKYEPKFKIIEIIEKIKENCK